MSETNEELTTDEIIEEEEEEKEEKDGPLTFAETMQRAMETLESQKTEDKNDDEIKHIGKVITLLQGKRVRSDLIQIAPGINMRLASLTGRQQGLIGEACLDKEEKNEDGSPIYNERLAYNMTIALMMIEMNGISIVDPFDKESGISTMKELWDEIDSRTSTFTNWNPDWLAKLSKAAEDFTYTLAEATCESNVKAF